MIPRTPPWQTFRDEVARWADVGRTATLWWRDDDAHTVTPALEKLLTVSDGHAIALGLAVIPVRADAALSARLVQARYTHVLQHGYSHANHAPAGQKKAEFGAHRPMSDLLADAGAGWLRIAALPRATPVFVPPWNRWTPALAPGLAALGFSAVSTYGPRAAAHAASGLAIFNTHADLIDWRGSRGFAGDATVLGALTAHLARRRLRTADQAEPSGLLTHHLDHDDKCWQFIEQFFCACADMPAVRWIRPDELTALASSRDQ